MPSASLAQPAVPLPPGHPGRKVELRERGLKTGSDRAQNTRGEGGSSEKVALNRQQGRKETCHPGRGTESSRAREARLLGELEDQGGYSHTKAAKNTLRAAKGLPAAADYSRRGRSRQRQWGPSTGPGHGVGAS